MDVAGTSARANRPEVRTGIATRELFKMDLDRRWPGRNRGALGVDDREEPSVVLRVRRINELAITRHSPGDGNAWLITREQGAVLALHGVTVMSPSAAIRPASPVIAEARKVTLIGMFVPVPGPLAVRPPKS